MMRRVIATLLTILFVGNMLWVNASASSSGLNYTGSTLNETNFATSAYVSINSNNTIIASSYSNQVYLHDAEDLSIIHSFDVGREVYDLQFSPNGGILAITISGISQVADSVLFFDIENLILLDPKSKTNHKRSSIDWAPDGNFIAVSNFQNGINIIEFETMEFIELSNQHQSDVTCIKFSNDGQLLVSGDDSGIIHLWQKDGTYTGKSFSLDGEITGCGFNYQNQRISAVSAEGNISTWTTTGNILNQMNIQSANGMQWSNSLDQIFILESGSEPKLLQLDGSTLNVISKTYFFHKTIDFDIHLLSDGRISDVYVSTDSRHVSNYATPELPYGYGQSGTDLDGDNIPDALDDDDDGDSFLDEWDFNCPVEIIACHRNPDVNSVRSVNLYLEGDVLIIDDTYTFGLYDSAEIRNLTRRSLISDQQISHQEANLFEDSICANIDSDEIISSWFSAIELSVGQVVNGTIECIIVEGLALTKIFDANGIKLTFRVSFEIIPNASLPLIISILEQVTHSDSSITHLVENHPIYLTSNFENSNSEGRIWWNDEGKVELEFEEVSTTDDNLVNSLISQIRANIIVIIVICVLIISSMFLLIRRRNKISIDFDDDDEEDFDDPGPNAVDEDVIESEISKPSPISMMEKKLEFEEEMVRSELTQVEDSPLQRRAFMLDDDDREIAPLVKRRAGKMDRNRQGPIMSTKRKRLGGEGGTRKEKHVNIRTVKKNVKTRRVKKTSNENDEPDIEWDLD